MKVIKIWNDNPSEKQVAEICGYLSDGEVIIIPTDTLYAIACDALNVKAIEKLCKIKGINPEKTNLSIMCSSIAMAAEYARIGNSAFKILKDNTPGPFTFLFKASSSLPKVFKGRKIVGIRIPDNKVCLDIINFLEHPLLTTSVEFSDEDNAVNPGLIAENYSHCVDLMVEGEEGGIDPSTIVDFTEDVPEIIRQGKGELS